jgi:hypothetical protein
MRIPAIPVDDPDHTGWLEWHEVAFDDATVAAIVAQARVHLVGESRIAFDGLVLYQEDDGAGPPVDGAYSYGRIDVSDAGWRLGYIYGEHEYTTAWQA